jgi:nucleoside-diphosphate-sugar epimerase
LGRDGRRISLIYVLDLVKLLILALQSENALGQTYFGCAEDHSYVEFSDAIAQALGERTLQITIPKVALEPMALWAKIQSRIAGEPSLLNEQRIGDMRQRFWLCSGKKAQRELGFSPEYKFESAVRETTTWYLDNGWL